MADSRFFKLYGKSVGGYLMTDLTEYLNRTHTTLVTREAFDELKRRSDALDKIRAEIVEAYSIIENDYDVGRNYGLYMATQIIDKYTIGKRG